MAERKAVVRDEVGLHARPASLFVKKAKEFDSNIRVRHKDSEANAKSILEILKLDAGKDAEVTLSAEGDDADEALDALTELLS